MASTTPLYYVLTHQRERTPAIDAMLVRVDQFEALLKRNHWPLGNSIDVVDRHVEYQQWYPGDYSVTRDDPTARAYHTLARLSTMKDILAALGVMRDIAPWNKPEDFEGEVQQELNEVALPERPMIVVTPPPPRSPPREPVVTPPRVPPPGAPLVPAPVLPAWDPSTLPGYDPIVGFKNTTPDQWDTLKQRALLAQRQDIVEALQFVENHAALMPRMHEALSLAAFIKNENDGWIGFDAFAKQLLDRLQHVERVILYIRGIDVKPLVLPTAPTWQAIRDLVAEIDAAAKFYGVFLYTTELTDPTLMALYAQIQDRTDIAGYRSNFIIEQAALEVANAPQRLVVALKKYLGWGSDFLPSMLKKAASPLPAEVVQVNDVPLDVQIWVHTHEDELFIQRSALALASLRDAFSALRMRELLGADLYGKVRRLFNANGALPTRIDDSRTVQTTENYGGFLIYGAGLTVAKIRTCWECLYWSLQHPTMYNLDRLERQLDVPELVNHAKPRSITRSERPYVDLMKRQANPAELEFRFVVPRLAWVSNSCWLDATLTALFIHGDAPLARWFLDPATHMAGYAQKLTLTMKEETGVPPLQIGPCEQADMVEFYNALLSDVRGMLTPKPRGAVSCELRVRSLWNTCVVSPVEQGRFASADLAMKSLQTVFFRERCIFDEQRVPGMLAQHYVNAWDHLSGIQLAAEDDDAAPPPLNLLAHIFATGWSNEYRPGWQGNFVITAPRTLYGGAFFLASVIVASYGHYTVLVWNKTLGVWYDINVQPANQGGTIVTDSYAQLPLWATTINDATLEQRKPSMFVYLRA